MGREPDSRAAQQGQQGQQGQRPQAPHYPYGARRPQAPQPQPYGQQPGYGGPPPAGRHPGPGPGQPPPYGHQVRWPQAGAAADEPEYFSGHHDPYYAPGPGAAPHADSGPGQTQQFSMGEAPDAQGGYGDGPGAGYSPYSDEDAVNTYRAGASTAPPIGPRLHWKELLSGIVLRPNSTFWQMRDHTMWGPALIVTFLYGALAVFGFDDARSDVLNASMGNSIPWVLCTGVAVLLSGLVLGAVTHTLARQLGGDGAWAPTIGLSMLIMSISDAPRLLFAMFLGGDSPFVRLLGWATWLAAGVLFTSMVSKSHDLPWPKALGASAIQLVALLSIVKLGTL